MTTPPVIATSITTLRHRVRLTHASTGEVIGGVRLAPVLWPLGWSARVVASEVIVVSRDDAPAASVPTIDVVITDGVLRHQLVLPIPEPDQPPDSVRVPLVGPIITQALPPADMVLIVALVDEGTGTPSGGKTVTVKPSSGSAVSVPETTTPGTYSSAPRAWGSAFTNADLRIGTTAVRKVSMDFTRSHTRITVVDPT